MTYKKHYWLSFLLDFPPQKKNKVCFHVDPERDLTFTGLDAAGLKLRCFPSWLWIWFVQRLEWCPPEKRTKIGIIGMIWLEYTMFFFVVFFGGSSTFWFAACLPDWQLEETEDGSCPGTEEADKIQKFWGKPFGINCWAPRSLRKCPFSWHRAAWQLPLPSAFVHSFGGCKDLGMTSWPGNAQFHVVMRWFLRLFFIIIFAIGASQEPNFSVLVILVGIFPLKKGRILHWNLALLLGQSSLSTCLMWSFWPLWLKLTP